MRPVAGAGREVPADLLDQFVHVVRDHADVGLVTGDDGQVRALSGTDDEQ